MRPGTDSDLQLPGDYGALLEQLKEHIGEALVLRRLRPPHHNR
ncbi:hypothetical protein [Blastococcus sp. TF02A_35]|nr:hypothetical protein [Blastococcus sp. TF02A_35]